MGVNPTFEEVVAAHEYFTELGGEGAASMKNIQPPDRGTAEYHALFYHTAVACSVAEEMKLHRDELFSHGETGIQCSIELAMAFSKTSFGSTDPRIKEALEMFGKSTGIGYAVEKVTALLRDYISFKGGPNVQTQVLVKVHGGPDEIA